MVKIGPIDFKSKMANTAPEPVKNCVVIVITEVVCRDIEVTKVSFDTEMVKISPKNNF